MRRAAVPSFLALTPFVVACAGGPGGGGMSPPSLAFQVPDDPQVTYSQADTAVMSIDAGGQMFDVSVVTTATMALTFTSAENGVRVTTSWTALDASVSNPMGAPERVSVEDVEGPLVFDLDSRGVAQVVSPPTLKGNASRMVSPAAVANSFFPRLPGSAPTPGMTWTDTISYEADEDAGTTISRTIVTYTVAGDTTVAGQGLLKVDMTGQVSQTAEGVTSGMGFVQDVAGGFEGYFLWDLREGVMHSQVSESEMVGTMDVDAAPFPLDIAVRGVSRVVRQVN
ncbi:MAG: hypothetical protein JSU98_06140 [Gemmatimonadales bacterium]|nr:MAG: hypothetical protein JSU98_06140 [Gemmatimonadales bacterium]